LSGCFAASSLPFRPLTIRLHCRLVKVVCIIVVVDDDDSTWHIAADTHWKKDAATERMSRKNWTLLRLDSRVPIWAVDLDLETNDETITRPSRTRFPCETISSIPPMVAWTSVSPWNRARTARGTARPSRTSKSFLIWRPAGVGLVPAARAHVKESIGAAFDPAVGQRVVSNGVANRAPIELLSFCFPPLCAPQFHRLFWQRFELILVSVDFTSGLELHKVFATSFQ
jgi:hypothetical protein